MKTKARTKNKPNASRRKAATKDPNVYPKGWNRKRVQAIIRYHDRQTDDEAIAEAEAAYRDPRFAMIAVPIDLVPAVERLIARRAS